MTSAMPLNKSSLTSLPEQGAAEVGDVGLAGIPPQPEHPQQAGGSAHGQVGDAGAFAAIRLRQGRQVVQQAGVGLGAPIPGPDRAAEAGADLRPEPARIQLLPSGRCELPAPASLTGSRFPAKVMPRGFSSPLVSTRWR